MRRRVWLGMVVGCAASMAQAADYKTLRNLNAAAPTQAPALPAGSNPRPVQFARIVIQPKDGEAWAVAYTSITIRAENDDTPAYKLMTWNSGRVEAQTAAYARIFNEEMKRSGFATDGGESLFGEGGSTADLKLGVTIEDIKGRFCVDCPNLFNRNGIPASVVMTANWEIYSTLERRTLAKITTSGGADFKTRLQGNFTPAVYEGFRENVRQLLANEQFRTLVTAPPGTSTTPAAPAAAALQLVAGAIHLGPAQATTAVAVIFAADGSGSGFLISSDGYVLTNQHVAGGSKYVKLKWSDGSETLGEVIRTDARRDVALIKTEARGRAPLDLRHSAVQQGEPVYAIGSPLGEALQNTMTKGIVSATRVQEGMPFIQSDVAVTHGNSGGPLLDEKGRVIGLTESGMAPNGSPIGLNFFIPIDDALRALALTPAAEQPMPEPAGGATAARATAKR